MSIDTSKVWTVRCDSCFNIVVVWEGDKSEWTDTGQIFNRGQVDTHLRRAGWQMGKTHLCGTCRR